jgi:predicted nucleic acid-binding protein
MNVVDTSGWLAYFFGSTSADAFSPAIEATDKLIVPTICLYEVFKKVNLVAGEAKALQAVAQMKQGRVVTVTEAVALQAAQISIRYKIPMADSLILATAWLEQATLVTQDEHFKGLAGVEYIKPD